MPDSPVPGDRAELVRVKPLEWDLRDGRWVARPTSGPNYLIEPFHRSWDLLIDGNFVKPYIAGVRETYSLEGAQAAAQADYRTRILSALVPSPLEGELDRLREALSAIASHPRDFNDGGVSFGVGWAFTNVKAIATEALAAPARAPDANLEAAARRIAARKMGLSDLSGAKLPDDLWRQALPDARAALTPSESL